jgi:acetylornithine deacetylase/succinyl-diaminopimelate desuccinylase-like protein
MGFPNRERPSFIKEGRGDAHQPDEFLSISSLLSGMEIFAAGLLKLDEIEI